MAAEECPEDPQLTVERIFDSEEFNGESGGDGRWLKDGSGYTVLEDSETLDSGRDLVRYDVATGERSIWIQARQFVPEGSDRPLAVEDYAWSGDQRKLLIFTNSRRVWRRNTRGDYWVLDLERGVLRQLGGRAEPASLLFASFSPQGDRVAYVCGNDLYVQRLSDWRVRRVTRSGSKHIVNGTSDWVNEEELDLRQAYRWSPDGRWLAYWQFDTSQVGTFRIVDNTQGLYPVVQAFPYPKAGETNSACRVGVVKANGGRTRWLETGADPRNRYIPTMEWAPDSASLVLCELNRLQNTQRVFHADVRSGRLRSGFTDVDEAWVDAQEGWWWVENGKSYLWLSERDGWRHLYRIPSAGGAPQLLTPGDYDVLEIIAIDEPRGWVYFSASPDNPTQRYLYRVSLGGWDERSRVTPMDVPGTHAYRVSPDARWAFHTVSRLGVPPRTALIRLPNHESVRGLVDNSELRDRLETLTPCTTEFFRVNIGEGVSLDGWCLKPPGWDPDRKYPVLFHVYGEPAGQTVLDRWGGKTYLWHWMLAQQGIVVMSVDNRGTPAPRGREWRKSVYRQVGILAAADQASAVRRLLADRPYLDPERVGVWGWSGGGSMTLNAVLQYPELYHVGMAVAFVSDQRLYDTIYQERYMGLPAENAAGYREGSPVQHAAQLKADLLLVYGTGDDNCHYQNCEMLINRLVEHHRPFQLLAYPSRTHGIGEGQGTRRHLYESLTRFLRDHLSGDVHCGP